MKKSIGRFISSMVIASFIMTGCAKDNSIEGDPPGVAGAHLYINRGRVIEILEKDLVLVTIIQNGNGCQKGDSLAIKYDVAKDDEASEKASENLSEKEREYVASHDLEAYLEKPAEVQVGDIVYIQYDKHEREKRDIGEIKDCNYVRTNYLHVITEEEDELTDTDDSD